MYEYVDLYVNAAISGQIDDLPQEMLLPCELHLLDCIAVKQAGGEHLVHWEASEVEH
jgi:hypothetical protein